MLDTLGLDYIENARGQLRKVWAEFDIRWMSIGALLAFLVSSLIGLNNFHLAEFSLAAILAAFCTSNSFIIMEDQIVQFLLHLVTALQTYIHVKAFTSKYKVTFMPLLSVKSIYTPDLIS